MCSCATGACAEVTLRVDAGLGAETKNTLYLSDTIMHDLGVCVGSTVHVAPSVAADTTHSSEHSCLPRSRTVFGSLISRALSGKHDSFVSRVVLLYGATGNGKTRLIGTTCKELSVSCVEVQPWGVFAQYPGEAERACTSFLAQAVQQQPCLCMCRMFLGLKCCDDLRFQ